MRKWMFPLLAVLLFLSLAAPVWADDNQGEVILFGESRVIAGDEVVDGNVTVIGGNLELREGGRVRGDVACLGGTAVIDGQVEGSLVVIGSTVDLQANALVDEDLFTLGSRVSRAPGATIRGERIEGLRWNVPNWQEWRNLPQRWWRGRPWQWGGDIWTGGIASLIRLFVRSLALMALGVVLALVVPKQMAQVGQTVSQVPLASAGIGLLTLLVLLVVVPILVIICIGIPVVIVLAVAVVAALLLGRVAIGTLVGRRLLKALQVRESQPLLEVAVGVGLIELLTAVPCLGAVAGAIISLAGLGAVVLTRFGTMSYPPLAPTTVVASGPEMVAPPEGEKEEE